MRKKVIIFKIKFCLYLVSRLHSVSLRMKIHYFVHEQSDKTNNREEKTFLFLALVHNLLSHKASIKF